MTDVLGLRAFEAYQVDLPAGAETVPHDHVHDQVEDMYAVIAGSGWLISNAGESVVRPGDFISVDIDDHRHLRAGDQGLSVIAICASIAGIAG